MNDTQLYAQILGITAPWSVQSVDLRLKEQQVNILLSFDKAYHCKCPVCSKNSPRYDTVRRQWRHLDTCQLQTTITADIPRIECSEHGVRQLNVPWAESGSRFTLLFECLVIQWLQSATVSAVAAHMHLDWDTAHGIQRRAVERGLVKRAALTPVNITIDETSEKKGHNYLTIVSEGARILYVAADREKASIDGFWQTLKPEALQGIKSVSVDLWKAFSSSVLEHLANGKEILCLDRFHVAGYFGEAMNDVRKAEHRDLMSVGDETLKGMKYDFLRTNANVDNRTRRGFLDIAKSSLKTARAWAIKETAHLLWHFTYIGAAEREWKKLFRWMKRSRLEPMKKLARSLEQYLWMILNAIKLDVNSGCAEGNNSRIQKIKKMACGYRNTENFKTAIYFHLGGLDLLPSISPT